jgi:hypothetical protein
LTNDALRRRFARKEFHAMSPDATKKQPTTEISELQQFEIEYQVRLRAYQLYEARGREDGHELEDWFRAKEEVAMKKFRTASA